MYKQGPVYVGLRRLQENMRGRERLKMRCVCR